MPRSLIKALGVLVALLAVGCGDDEENPFTQFSFSRAPSEDAVLLYVSGAWAEGTGLPRELFAINADGSSVEQLTTCAQGENPCDFLQAIPSSNRDRILAVRGQILGDPEASALYFIDLNRSVETIIAAARRVEAADWALDDSFATYSNGDPEDLIFIRPNGDEERALTNTPDFRERAPRLDPTVQAIAYEGLSDWPGKSTIALFLGEGTEPFPITSGGPGSEPLPDTPYIVGSDASPVFAPNSLWVAFRRLTGTGNGGLGTWDILMAASDGSEETQVVVSGGDVYRGAPDWALDGRLVFVETDAAAGESRLVVVHPDGSERQVLHVEDAGYRMGSPRWLR